MEFEIINVFLFTLFIKIIYEQKKNKKRIDFGLS